MASTIQVDTIKDIGGNTMVSSNGSGTFTNNLPAPTSGIAASAIDSGTIATARLGSGTASSSTFLRGDQTYAEAGGGAWELLQSVNASSTATVDFTYDFPTTYNNYFIYFNDLELASNGNLGVRAQVGGASGVRTGSNDYASARYGRASNGNGGNTDLATGDANANMININNPANFANGDYDIQGCLWIMNPNDDHYKFFQFNAVYGTSGNNIANIQGGGNMYQNGDLSRVQFLNEQGANMTGTFRLYGVKNA